MFHTIKCFQCGREGHIKKECPERQNKKANIKCFKCGKHGHVARECPQVEEGFKISLYMASRSTSETSCCWSAELPTSTVSFIDTHCHLNYVFDRYRYRKDFRTFQKEHNFPENFAGCITTFCDPTSFSSLGSCDELLQNEQVWGAFGFHPHNAKYYNAQFEEKLIKRLEHPKAVALGEIGLDYSVRSQSDPEVQKQVFIRQVRLAESMTMPLVIHCRDAENDVFEILSTILPNSWKIHLHCYSGSYEVARKFFNHFPNLYVGITGIVTFSKATQVHDVVYHAPIDRLLLETDAPYLIPRNVDKEMKWSHPGMIPLIAQEVAKLKKLDVNVVLEHALQNTKNIYGI